MAIGFKRVRATPEEIAEYKAKHGGWAPHVYRVQCEVCGKRMWGSGLGIGSHRKVCAPSNAEFDALMAAIKAAKEKSDGKS